MEWVDEGVPYPGTLRVIQYEDASEKSVIFVTRDNHDPALRPHQVRELVEWLTTWLAENE